MKMKIEILQRGDDVLNVWSLEPGLLKVAVKNKKGEVYIYSVITDEQNIPRVDKKHTLIITHGNCEVTTEIPGGKSGKSKGGDDETNNLKVESF